LKMHSKPIEEVFKQLKTSDKGLSSASASERLKQYGLNEIKEAKKISAWEIFFAQFKSVVLWILIIATIISAFLKEYVDAIVILVIIVLIAVLGFILEYRAEKSIEALKKLEKPEVKPEVSIAQKRNRQAEAWLAQGTTLAQQGETQKALGVWRKVLELEGVNPSRYAKAEQFINFEKERLSQKYAPLLSQAYALIETKEYGQAQEILDGVLKEYPTHKEAKEALYKVQDALHQMARREYTEAIIDENVGRVDSAVKKFKWIIERAPASDEYHRKAKNKLKKYE